ncbi:hypothetical protein ACN28S_20500 [Cystobacter fuscus]
MKRAAVFMDERVSYRGGYVWAYLADLSKSWGEMEAKRTMCWIQPPGTPSAAHSFLDAYHATGDEAFYRAAERSCRRSSRRNIRPGAGTTSTTSRARSR